MLNRLLDLFSTLFYKMRVNLGAQHTSKYSQKVVDILYFSPVSNAQICSNTIIDLSFYSLYWVLHTHKKFINF